METQFTSRIWWTSVIWRKPNLQTLRKTQGASCVPRGQHQRRRRIRSSIRWARCFSVSDGSGQVIAAYTQIKMIETPRWLQMPIEECLEIWIIILPRPRPNSWNKKRNLFGHPLANFSRERQFEEVENTNMGMSFTSTKSLDYSFRFMLNELKRLERSITCMDSEWKKLPKGIAFEDPTSFLDQVHSGCMQREGKVGPQVAQSKTELCEKLTTTREADEKRSNEKEIFVGKDHCFGLWYGRSWRKLHQ